MIKNRFPNQYKVVINKEEVNRSTPDRRYFIAYQETLEAAARELTGNEFKLYVYFLSNRDKYEDLFSPDFFGKSYGVSADTARKLFQKLIEKGFLVKTAAHDCEFYDRPQKKIKISVKVEKRYVIDDDGVIYEMSYSDFRKAALEDGEYTEEELKAAWNTFEIVKEV